MLLRTSTLAAAGLVAVLPAAAISPQQMLSAPRYGTAQANPSGEYAIYTANQYSFDSAKRTTWWNLVNLQTGSVTRWHNSTSDLSEVVFIGPTNTSILYLNGTSLYSADLLSLSSATKIATLPGPFSGLKVARTPSGDVRFLVTAKAYPNATVYDEEAAATPKSTARIYNSIYPRHWVSSAQHQAVICVPLALTRYSHRTSGFRPRRTPCLAALSRRATARPWPLTAS